MGTHISKVKSIDLDMWTPEQLASVQKWGNTRVNLYWEAHLKAGHTPPDHKMDSFIRSKYESRRWALEGPPPSDPSTLEQSSTSTEDVPSTITGPSTASSNTLPAPPVVTTPALIHDTSVSNTRTLLSASHTPAPSNPPTTAINANPQNDLFSLDFSASQPASVATPAGSKDVKQDIMSLFSSNSAPVASAPGFGVAAPQGNIGANATPWGVDAWNLPANNSHAAANPPGVTAWSNPQFSTAPNVWATSSTQNGGVDLFSTPRAAQSTSKKQDDAFGDLWGGFK
ncbi:SPARC- modular calcium-binding protein 2 [Serendipita sp. 399]|nr:SPARC- modular calcium-binding protein 2 [Serendipita sp. 399]